MERFGEKLHVLRVYHGLSLKELAQELGYATHSYLSELEAGQKLPTVKFVLSVSRLFKVTTDQLLKDELDIQLPDKDAIEE